MAVAKARLCITAWELLKPYTLVVDDAVVLPRGIHPFGIVDLPENHWDGRTWREE